VEYNAALAAERDHQDGCPDESLREGAVLHPVRLRVAVYRLGIGGLDASAVAHRDGVVGGFLSEVRPDVDVEKSVGRARAGQEQVASELRFARWLAEQQDEGAVPCKRVLGQFAVRSCGAVARPALY
jgi:hypothetical protein